MKGNDYLLLANYHKIFFFRFLNTPRSSYNSILIFSEALPVQSRYKKRNTLRCPSPIFWLFFSGGGGAVITLYSPVWASTPGNPQPQAPKYCPDKDRRSRPPSRSPPRRAPSQLHSPVGSPSPTRERGPRGQRLRGEKQRRRRGLKGTAPRARASPIRRRPRSRERAAARSLGPRSCRA
jgi:hypothetical protein